MNETNINKITELLWVATGIIFVCVSLATFRVIHEIIEPSNSGIGTWYPFIQLPVVIIISCIIATVVQTIAKFARWSSLTLKRHLLGIGGMCALSTISTLTIMFLVFIVTLWVRYELSFVGSKRNDGL